MWIRNHELSDASSGIARKFLPKWIGPFSILKKLGDTYIIDVVSKLVPKRHVSDIKPFIERSKNLQKVPVSIGQAQLNKKPVVPVIRQLRARKHVDYRRLAGFKVKH